MGVIVLLLPVSFYLLRLATMTAMALEAVIHTCTIAAKSKETNVRFAVLRLGVFADPGHC